MKEPSPLVSDLGRMAGLITSVSETELASDPTLGGRLVLSRAGDLNICYAPFEFIQRSAKLVLVGITPGKQQARNALVEARRKLLAGADIEVTLSSAKVFASFSGQTMRSNLVAMLDHIGINRWLEVST